MSTLKELYKRLLDYSKKNGYPIGICGNLSAIDVDCIEDYQLLRDDFSFKQLPKIRENLEIAGHTYLFPPNSDYDTHRNEILEDIIQSL